MAVQELHPFNDAEIASVSQKCGVYVLFQLENPLLADTANNLRKELRAVKSRFPNATHFSVESLGRRMMLQRVRQLQKELGLVRAVGFVGTRRH
jgi:hypothetical protein